LEKKMKTLWKSSNLQPKRKNEEKNQKQKNLKVSLHFQNSEKI